jgi:hypothetical protein
MMCRSLALTLLGAAALVAAGAASVPAVAQFGSIFREEVPRPPAEVPMTRTAPPNFPEPIAPPPQQRPAPPPPVPAQPSPFGGIQSQPLPPPPGIITREPEQAARPSAPPAEPAPSPPPTAGQRPPATPPGGPAVAGLPPSEVVVEPPPRRVANPTAVFAGLDKITGRIISFDVAIDETVQFGALQVTPRACYSRPPTEAQRTNAFVTVDEVTLQGEVRRIFTGWMFAASPGLHAVEHPIYDVWLTDCKGGLQNVAEEPAAADAAPQKPAPTAPRPPRRR